MINRLFQDPTESILNAISSNKYDKDKSTSPKPTITDHSIKNSTIITTANSTAEAIDDSDSTKALDKNNLEIKSDDKTTSAESLSLTSSSKDDSITTETKEPTKDSVAKSIDKVDTTSIVQEKTTDSNDETGDKHESTEDKENMITDVQESSHNNSTQT